jgi:hypothetical protein
VAGTAVWPTREEWLRVLDRVGAGALAGLITGLLVGGVGGRLAMFLLRLTSDDGVRGLETDDGFTIGEFSGETLFLVAITTLAGMLLALLYVAVRRWLPERARPLQMAVFFALLGGALVVDPGGVDFSLLDPLPLAVALFVALPALYGAAMAALVEWLVAHPGRWRPSRVAALVVFAVLGTFGLVGVLIAIIGFGVFFAAQRWPALSRVALTPAATWVVRGLLVVVAVLSAIDLVGDTIEIL